MHYDVLIVGAGNAACAAALAALERKVSVGILEKAPQRDRGGNSALTGHMRFVFEGIDDLRGAGSRSTPTPHRCSTWPAAGFRGCIPQARWWAGCGSETMLPARA